MKHLVLPDFDSIRENLASARKVFVRSDTLSGTDMYVRQVEEACGVLDAVEKLQRNLFQCFAEHCSLEDFFNSDFGPFGEFTQTEKILEICFREDYLFPVKELMPFTSNEEFDLELISSHIESIKSWCLTRKNNHEFSQEQINSKFNLGLDFKKLSCTCTKCTADYRGKLRDLVFHECLENMSNLEKWLRDHLESCWSSLSIKEISTEFYNRRKTIDQLIHSIRYKLKKSSVKKLERQLKQLLLDRFSPETELGKIYITRLRVFCVELLQNEKINQDFVSEEFVRFFNQLGINIWRDERFLKSEFNKLVKSVLALKRKDISSNILQDYLGQFWIHAEARKFKRKIIYHMGPTNSGKTFYAVKRLAEVESGCYLAPLRLLASELYDTLTGMGVKTTLLTGEEVVEAEGATHYSSTIEMARLQMEFDCCVIDEIQMISDSQRGWAWTRAFVSINAKEVHLCGDNTVLDLIKQIVTLTGDELEIKEYQRMTELKVESKPLVIGQLEKGDALIVFSRKNALKYKADLERIGFKVSIVYGRLGPEVRREQARKFDVNETDIMVSTDAISMGMNLPIKRIVFSTLVKHFDSREYPITNSEIKQISGRAGRYNRYPVGFVTCLTRQENGIEKITAALEKELSQSSRAMVGPDLEIFNSVNRALQEHSLPVLKLSEFLLLFNTMIYKRPFYCVDLSEMIELAEMVEDINKDKETLSSAEIFGFTCAPVNLGLVEHVQYFHWIVSNFVNGRYAKNEHIDETSNDIDYLETAIKCVELYQWLARHFKNKFFDFDDLELLANKSMAVAKLNDLLSERLTRNCSSCGAKLDDSFQFNICEKCFRNQRSNYKRGARSGGGKFARNKGKRKW